MQWRRYKELNSFTHVDFGKEGKPNRGGIDPTYDEDGCAVEGGDETKSWEGEERAGREEEKNREGGRKEEGVRKEEDPASDLPSTVPIQQHVLKVACRGLSLLADSAAGPRPPPTRLSVRNLVFSSL